MKPKQNKPEPSGAVVIDSSAVLAYLRQEKGADVVAAHLQGAKLSTVNLCEVLAKAVELGGDDQLVRELLDGFDVTFIEFTQEHAAIAADLRIKTRLLGLSLGDRACLALGMCENALVLTADRRWDDPSVTAGVKFIR